MKGTVYGNRLARGTQVKKVGNHCHIGLSHVGRHSQISLTDCFSKGFSFAVKMEMPASSKALISIDKKKKF